MSVQSSRSVCENCETNMRELPSMPGTLLCLFDRSFAWYGISFLLCIFIIVRGSAKVQLQALQGCGEEVGSRNLGINFFAKSCCLPQNYSTTPLPSDIKLSSSNSCCPSERLSRGVPSFFHPLVRWPSLSAFDVSWECEREAAEYKARQPADRTTGRDRPRRGRDSRSNLNERMPCALCLSFPPTFREYLWFHIPQTDGSGGADY